MTTTTGVIDYVVGNETFQTWYKVVGDLKSSTRPVVVLHGGPGMSHNYILPHVDLYASRGIPVIFYDQIGIGHSTHLPDRGADFWTYDLFMNELQNLLTKLNIVDDYDLLGHSWGGMLAAQFAGTHKPTGLKHLVLVGTPASMELWIAETTKLLAGLPQDIKDTLKKHQDEGTTDSKEYEEATYFFYRKHVNTVQPWPQDLLDSVTDQIQDPTVYHVMNGPSEFDITGTIKTWSVIDLIPEINYPTLITNGLHDEAQDPVILPFFKKLPRVKWVQFMEGSHHPFWECREKYMKIVGDFLTSV